MSKIKVPPHIYIPVLLSKYECNDLLRLSDILSDLTSSEDKLFQIEPRYLHILNDICKQIVSHSDLLKL